MDTRELAWKEYKNRLPSLNCKRIMVAKHFKTGKDMIFVEGQTVWIRFKLICLELMLSQFRKGNEAVQPVAINNITFPPNAPRPAPLSARNVSLHRMNVVMLLQGLTLVGAEGPQLKFRQDADPSAGPPGPSHLRAPALQRARQRRLLSGEKQQQRFESM
ncbi:hypothetical protein GUITHDRAFT_155956, partial [Guillardia theta CCMP2712]